MRPILFRVGGVPIYSYPAMLYLGIVLGMYAQLHAARLAGLDPRRTLIATLVLLIVALLGARLLFVIPHWAIYRREPRRIWRCSEGGASMYGGLLLAVPLSVPLAAMLRLPLATFWDAASFVMLVGMIVTRSGCFLNGCCAGRPTHGWLGLDLPNYRGVWTRRVPNQVLEAGWGLLVLGGAMVLWSHRPFRGAVILYALAAYGIGRSVLETAREEPVHLRGVRLQRAISVALVAVALTVFVVVSLS